MGILLATGLLILTPLAGWVVLVAIGIRILAKKVYGQASETPLTIFGAARGRRLVVLRDLGGERAVKVQHGKDIEG